MRFFIADKPRSDINQGNNMQVNALLTLSNNTSVLLNHNYHNTMPEKNISNNQSVIKRK